MKIFLFLLGLMPKVVSLSPNITEMLIDLGCEKNIVGVTDYCEVPENLNITTVGGWINPNWEVILMKEPDLILLTDVQFSLLRDRIESIGISAEVLPSRRLEDVFVSFIRLGRIFHREGVAKEIVEGLRDSILKIEEKLKGKERPSVLVVVDRTPGDIRNVYVAGGENFLDDLVSIAGGRNPASSLGNGYFPVSLETIIKLNPDIILDLSENPIDEWSRLQELDAYRRGKIYQIPPSPTTHPSTRFLETVNILLKYLHPEVKFESR
jgi:iron complex transport system substrate-binding protein